MIYETDYDEYLRGKAEEERLQMQEQTWYTDKETEERYISYGLLNHTGKRRVKPFPKEYDLTNFQL